MDIGRDEAREVAHYLLCCLVQHINDCLLVLWLDGECVDEGKNLVGGDCGVVEVMSATLLVTWKEARSNSWCGDPAGVPLRRRSFRLDLPTESANEEAAEIAVSR